VHVVGVEQSGRVLVVRASGELDAYAAPDLESAFAEAGGAGLVVADLGSVSFMDSTALGSLVRCVRQLDEGDSEVRVVLPRGAARRIFEITALERALPVVADVRAALDELSG
jgi:anti-sigma B factor antagonist